ncbi:toxin Cry1Ac domain D-VI-related protein [Listeria booriae]|uniref:toxin Cry1Ac domain D-VI-related protein n=1 Tax=Listeria booriae TaxID=1552123 RepID=UPI001629BEF3|nr:toxin Cry1Ac domain D-VI-related protein [Listeria booriae]MBC1799999.1 hypothetical protein [Listeria booriae]
MELEKRSLCRINIYNKGDFSMITIKKAVKKIFKGAVLVSLVCSMLENPINTYVNAAETQKETSKLANNLLQGSLVEYPFSNSSFSSTSTTIPNWTAVTAEKNSFLNRIIPAESASLGIKGSDGVFRLNNTTTSTIKPSGQGGFQVFTTYGTDVGLQQTVTTIPGKKYTLTFNYSVDNYTVHRYQIAMYWGSVYAKVKVDDVATNVGKEVKMSLDGKIDTEASEINRGSSGTITYSFTAISDKSKLSIMGRADLGDNPPNTALITFSSPKLVSLTDAVTDSARKAVNELFVNYDVNQGSRTDISLEDIANVQTKINLVTDTIEKAALQSDLDQAKNEFITRDASKAVRELFLDNILVNDIKPTITQANIDSAQVKVNMVTDSKNKEVLQGYIDKAQKQLNPQAIEKAKEIVSNLFINSDVTKHIKGLVDQSQVDTAKALVESLKDETQKDLLLVVIEKAQKEVDAFSNAVVTGLVYTDDTVLWGSKGPSTGEIAFKIYDATGTWIKAQKVVDTTSGGVFSANLVQGWATAAKQGDPLTGSSTISLTAGDKVQAGHSEMVTIQYRYQNVIEAVNQLFINDDKTKHIKALTDQVKINAAKSLVNTVKDTMLKVTLLENIEKAQAEFDALANVIITSPIYTDATFFAGTKGQVYGEMVFKLYDSTGTWVKAQKIVTTSDTGTFGANLSDWATAARQGDPLTGSSTIQLVAGDKVQAGRSALVTIQSRYQDAIDVVNQLFIDNDSAKDIKATTTQTMIDVAQTKVNTVLDTTLKAKLQESIDKAQRQLDQRAVIIAKPSVGVVTNNDTTVKGNGVPGLTIVVRIGTVDYLTTVQPNGTFSVNIPLQVADTILTVFQKNTITLSNSVSVKVVNYIPSVKVTIDSVHPLQETITGKAPAGTKLVRILVNGIAQRTTVPEADGSFSFYTRFVTDGISTNKRLQAGDTVTVDYGNRTPENLATTIIVSAN